MRLLSQLKVLDLSRQLPGPMATRHLSDLGADVIRVEPVADDGEARDPRLRVLRLLLDRNKRAIRLDLARPGGRDVFLRLAKDADVIVEGFRPGVVDRLGIGYEAVRGVNARIVYCAISGYGQTGPDRLRAGHDINYLASSGVADQIGVADGPPAIPNLQIGDLLGGSLTAVMGILAALVDRRAHYIDVSMTDSLLAHSVLALSATVCRGEAPARGDDLLSGAVPCYNYYRAADGRYLAVGALEAKFWERLCDAIGRPELKPHRLAHGEHGRRVRSELQEIFGARTSDDWAGVFDDVDCCVTPVLTPAEAIAAPQARAREMVVEMDAGGGKLLRFAPPLKIDGGEPGAGTPAPEEAQTRPILAAAGYRADEIDALFADLIVA